MRDDGLPEDEERFNAALIAAVEQAFDPRLAEPGRARRRRQAAARSRRRRQDRRFLDMAWQVYCQAQRGGDNGADATPRPPTAS